MNNEKLLHKALSVTAARQYDIDSHPPFVVQSARGAWLKDCDGRDILDMTSSNGTALFGYCNDEINASIIEQISQRGAIFPTTLSPQRISLAECIIERYPAAEKAVFFRTGSDGTTAAVRMVRAYTGRRLILSSGYHGWHDWHRKFDKPGWDAQCDIFHFGYNLDILSKLLEQGQERIAGVIVTPEPGWYSVDHLKNMYQLCLQKGIPFILDEVMSGLRYGAAGLNGSGVPADLVVISKGLANGLALSCVMGKADIIDSYDAAGLAGTYNKEVTPMAAGLTALRLIKEQDPYPAALAIGSDLMTELQQAANDADVPLWVTGAPLMFKTVFSSAAIANTVTSACFEGGVLMECNGTHMVNFSFGYEEKSYAVAIFKKALSSIKHSCDFTGTGSNGLNLSLREGYARAAFGAVFEDNMSHDIERAVQPNKGGLF
ncbi:aminotransferase class III-fold pyridoxal phosphate-dependent enzyme [Erwinia sp. HDF1-3R]|uniref:aminotransferase class III-fold pyridoxal phosphate-dependent enzyme n=1 Tax=Erwinia sp. HDF1-3R TaxID=3141543 RepID=UPI0031F511BC